jgi:hypothetical protein
MPRVDTKWKEYKGEKLVALKEPRQVSRVGYKIHRGLAKFHFLKEMDDRIAFGPEDETPDIDPYRIVGNHPKMVPYLSVRDTIREALVDTLQARGAFAVEPHRVIDKMLERLDRSVIRELVEQAYNALKAKEKEVPKREIYFSPLAQGDFVFLPRITVMTPTGGGGRGKCRAGGRFTPERMTGVIHARATTGTATTTSQLAFGTGRLIFY